MRISRQRIYLSVFTLVFMIAAGAGSAFSQGKGHGGGKGNGGGHGGPPPGAGRPGPGPKGQPKAPKPQPQAWQGQPKAPRPQPQREFRMPQPKFHPQPQPKFRPEAKVKAAREEFKIPRVKEPQRQKQAWIYDMPMVLQPPKIKGKKDKAWKNSSAVGWLPGDKRRHDNYGLKHADEVHLRKAERKALKEQAKLQGRIFNEHVNRVVRVDRDRNSWHDNVLRSVVYNVVSSAPLYTYVPQYQPTYVYQEPSFYGYQSYVPEYYSYYPQTVVTTYDFYQPYYYGYSGYSGVTPYYYTDSYYGNYYSDVLDMPYVSGSAGIGGVINRLFSQLVAYGYEQGFRDASIARSTGYTTEYFSDPYDPYVYVDPAVAFDDVGYDPYSCFGENRRYISDGYELGYRDALDGRAVFDPTYGESNVDLVSALISSVLSLS